MHAVQALSKVCMAIDGQGARTQRKPVSTSPHTGLEIVAQFWALRDSSEHCWRAKGSLGLDVSAGGGWLSPTLVPFAGSAVCAGTVTVGVGFAPLVVESCDAPLHPTSEPTRTEMRKGVFFMANLACALT